MLFGKLFTNPKMWVNGDADDIKMSGVYTCKDVQNVPTGDGALLVFKTENTVKQVFIPVGEEGVVYTRVLGEDWSSVSGTSEKTEALIQSAIDKANQAQAKADTVDTRLNNIIVDSGTSDAEVVAARTDSSGQTFSTLGVRLDTQFSEIKEDLNNLIITPSLRNGSVGNIYNANAVATRDTLNVTTKSIRLQSPYSVDGYYYEWNVRVNKTDNTYRESSIVTVNGKCDYAFEDDDTSFAVSLQMRLISDQSTYHALRVENVGNIIKIMLPKGCEEPLMRNGSLGNLNNQNAVSTLYTLPNCTRKCLVKYESYEHDGYDTVWTVFTYSRQGATGSIAPYIVSRVLDGVLKQGPYLVIDLPDDNSNYYGISLTIRNSDNVVIPQRVDDGKLYVINIDDQFNYLNDTVSELLDMVSELSDVVNFGNDMAVSASRWLGNKITFLHFTDIHADTQALTQINQYYNDYKDSIDDVICTGDMVANTGVPIASWWNPKYLTCVGNHDSATYNAGYDWTAISMADRSAYYIDPFEANWNIQHDAGKSYYYKDYSYFRLIVIDAMLYNDATSQEATDQTSWLSSVLDDAKTKGYHVMIATHAPHGGAEPVNCDFSKYGQGTMPTNTDCNTPDTIINLVANKISNGLVFAGYLCGHTHQDNIFDALNNKKQLMYVLTCAATTQQTQWNSQDLYRDIKTVPCNLVTIDTSRRIVKIVRLGADRDNYLRPRKTICFNYNTGTVID